jgi:hypothetical protein
MRGAPFGAEGVLRAPVESLRFPGVIGGAISTVDDVAAQLSVEQDEEAMLAFMWDEAGLDERLVFWPLIDLILTFS